MPYTCLYSVHPYWWKRQVSHQTQPSGSQHASKKECRQDIHSGFETHEEGHTKSKTGAISGSTKWTLVQTKKFKKKKKKRWSGPRHALLHPQTRMIWTKVSPVNRQTPVKTLPSPTLRTWLVIKHLVIKGSS